MRLETYSGDKPYIFISYAHKDADAVLPIIDAMQKQGFRIWFDQGIEAGTEWPEFIAEHLDRSESVIVFMSNAAAESKNCRREINYAIDINREPLVVYLEEVKLSSGLKLQLNTLQAMFKYRAKTDEDFIVELCRAKMLQSCREEVVEAPVPTPVVEPIPQPVPEPQPQPAPIPTPVPAPTPAPTKEPIPQPQPEPQPPITPQSEPETMAAKTKRSKKMVIIAAAALLVIVGIVVSIFASGGGDDIKVTSLVMSDGDIGTTTVDLHYRKPDNVVVKVEIEVAYDISEYEYNASELKDALNEIQMEAREEINDMPFASVGVCTAENTIILDYTFRSLDYDDYAKQMVDDFFGTKDYSPHYDEGDYKMYYVTMLSALENEGFTLVKK